MVINSEDLLHAQPIKSMLSRKVAFKGTSHGLAEAGYDIRIKQQIRFTSVRGKSIVLVTEVDHQHEVVGTTTQNGGRFALASAIEEFDMPSNLVGVVHDKSTWARRGLSVFNTVIEPGWKGFLTLELVYHGSEELIIPAGSGIAQVLFHELSLERIYNGKYQNQEDEPVPARDSI